MVKEYVEQRDGGYFINGARVLWDSVVYAFLRENLLRESRNPFRPGA